MVPLTVPKTQFGLQVPAHHSSGTVNVFMRVPSPVPGKMPNAPACKPLRIIQRILVHMLGLRQGVVIAICQQRSR